MGWLGWSLVILGLLAGLVSTLTIVGAFLPRDHVASRELNLKRPPAEVWKLLRDAPTWPTWWKTLKSVESLPERNGSPAFRLVYANGRNQFDLTMIKANEPTEIVTKIDDVNKMFEGTWTWSISPTAEGCIVRLTENGSIPNPFFRCMAKMMMNPAMYIEMNLKDLALLHGEEPNLRP